MTDETAAGAREPTEEELRAAYEAEIKKLRVEHLLLEHVVTLVNLGRRRTGLTAGTEDERDPEQVRLAIDSIRALLPVLEQSAPQQVGPIREALSQLQLAFVKIGGQPAQAEAAPGGPAPGGPPKGPGPGGPEGPGPGGPKEPPPDEGGTRTGPGPAQRSGRLWVPGQ